MLIETRVYRNFHMEGVLCSESEQSGQTHLGFCRSYIIIGQER